MIAGATRVRCAVLVLALAGWEPFRSPNPDVEAGNEALAEGTVRRRARSATIARRSDGSVDPTGLAYDRGTAELAEGEAGEGSGGARRR